MNPLGSPDTSRRWWLRRWLNRLEVDRATFYAVAARGWQFLVGPVTMLLIARFFTPEIQGYYYTFASTLALQALIDLGFAHVIVYFASHEWAHLELTTDGSVAGVPAALARLASLTKLLAKWYVAGAGFFIVGVGSAGFAFFGQKETGVAWEWPWWVLVGLTGVSFVVSGCVALLEGCNQVATVNRFRFLQAATGNAVVWLGISAGLGLWVTVLSAVVKLSWETYLIAIRYRRFWLSLWEAPPNAHLPWRWEIWPLQWRIALQSVFQYCASYLLVPVMFHYHGAALAGRTGMTWTALTAIHGIAFAWVQARLPLFGILIARRDYKELDRVFFRLTTISLAILLGVAAFFCAVVYALNATPHTVAVNLAGRLLPMSSTLVFSAGIVLSHLPRCCGVYLRAHKRDPLLRVTLLVNSSIGLSFWLLGSGWGPLAAAWGYVAAIAAIGLPATIAVWSRCRAQWHENEDTI